MTFEKGYSKFDARPAVPASEEAVQQAQATADAALEAAEGPTDPPATSPTPVVRGNVRVVFGSHTPVPLARSYDIYLSDTDASAPDSDHLATTATSTLWQITDVPEVMALETETGVDTDLQPGVIYYVAMAAKNDLGAAAPSAWVPVTLRPAGNGDIGDDYTYLGQVMADQIDAGTLSAVITLAGLLKTRQNEFEAGGEMDTVSLRGYAPPDAVDTPAPLSVEIAFDGRTSTFAGDIAARKFDAYQGADLHGDANNVKSDGGMTLEAGSSAGSNAAPSVTQGISSVELNRPSTSVSWGGTVTFNAAVCHSFNWDWPSNTWIAIQNISGQGNVKWRISPSGVVTYFGQSTSWYEMAWMRSPEVGSTDFWTLTAQVGNPSNTWLSGLKSGVASKLQIPRLNTAQFPVGTWSSAGNLRVTERVADTLVTRVYSISGANPSLAGTQTSDSWWPSSNPIGSVNVAQGPGFAAAQSVYCARGTASRIRVASSGVTELPDYEWDTPVALVGICTDGPDTASSGGSWYGLGQDNRLYKFGNSTWTGSFTKRVVVGTTSTTSTAETQVGSKVVVNLKRRHEMTVTAPPLVEPAIRAGVYAVEWASGLPTDSQMFRHGYTATGGRTLTIPTLLTSGAAPGTAPTAGAYPLAAPAFWRSEGADLEGPIIDLEGDGDFRLGAIRHTADGGPGTAYTPTLGGITLGAGGSITGRYQVIGKRVEGKIRFVAGTGSSYSGNLSFGLPFAAAGYSGADVLGHGHIHNGTTGSRTNVMLSYASSTTVNLVGDGLGTATATTPFTWGTSSVAYLSFSYERA